MNYLKTFLLIISLSLLAACGGGDANTTEVGTTPMKLAVILEGSSVAAIRGIHTEITLPAGVILPADANSQVMSGVITQATNTPSGIVIGKYTAATVATPAVLTIDYAATYPVTKNFAAGEVLILNVDLAPGIDVPVAAAFTFSNNKLVDANSDNVSGANLTIK